jgi:hypothetical protein
MKDVAKERVACTSILVVVNRAKQKSVRSRSAHHDKIGQSG